MGIEHLPTRFEKGHKRTNGMYFSTNLTWIARTLRGSVTMLEKFIRFNNTDPRALAAADEYDSETKEKLRALMNRSRMLTKELENLQADIAEFNRTKYRKKVEL